MIETSPAHALVDIIIPVYKEDLAVVNETIAGVLKAFEGRSGVSLFVVDDGSPASCNLGGLASDNRIHFIRHEINRGYGAALKTGILAGSAPLIAIADADGTYPVERLPEMVDKMAHADMVIGARISDVREIPLLRRFPKAMLNRFASYMSGAKIRDLNSGLRVFRRDLCFGVWNLLPQKFSFTSTITMGAVMSGMRVEDVAVDYFKRVGSSSIKPIRDTIRFFFLVMRLGMLFSPMKIFGPISLILFGVGAIKGLGRDYVLLGYVGNLSVALMLSGVQVFMMGLLGEMIVHTRNVQLGKRPGG